MLYSVVVWLMVPLLDLLAFKTNPLSVQNIVIDLILLPVPVGRILGSQMEMARLGKEVPRRHSPIWRIEPSFKKPTSTGCEAMVVIISPIDSMTDRSKPVNAFHENAGISWRPCGARRTLD